MRFRDLAKHTGINRILRVPLSGILRLIVARAFPDGFVMESSGSIGMRM